MNKKQSALLLASLCLSCSTAGSFSLSKGIPSAASEKSLSLSLDSEESSSIQSKEKDAFSQSYKHVDGMYQCMLNYIQSIREQSTGSYFPKFAGEPYRVYCNGEFNGKQFSLSDFPEVGFCSLEQFDLRYGVCLLMTLPEDISEEEYLKVAFLLIDNP